MDSVYFCPNTQDLPGAIVKDLSIPSASNVLALILKRFNSKAILKQYFLSLIFKSSSHYINVTTEEYVTILSFAVWPGHRHGNIHGQPKTSVLAFCSPLELATRKRLLDLI